MFHHSVRAAVLLSILVVSRAAQAQTTFNWTNTGGGSFHTAGNWSPAGGPPIFDDFAVFNLNSTYGVTFANNGTQTIDFQVRNGTVTFSYINPTANHIWTPAGTSLVGPLAGDAQTSATLNLINMASNPMRGGDLIVGHAAGKTGTLNIHTNGRWKAFDDYDVIVGRFGTGNVNISTTGTLQNSSMEARNIIAGQSGGTGNISVSGLNASLTANNVLTIGEGANSQGTLTISSQGKVNVLDSMFIGVASAKSNTAFVSGAGSELLLGNDLTSIGDAGGKGTLVVLNGGKVTNSGSFVRVGNGSGSDGSILVDGVGSQFLSNPGGSDSFRVGTGGTGTVQVSNGGNMTLGSGMDVGWDSSGSISALSGSSLITNGGRFGVSSGGTGTATVSGTGSSWNTSGSSNLVLGQSGIGNLDVLSGGKVTSTAVDLATAAGGQGNVKIDGSGSSWTINQVLNIGDAGSGNVAISNGGNLVAGNNVSIRAGNQAGSSGNLNVGNTGTNVLMGTGALVSIGSAGAGSLNLHSGAKILGGGGTIGNQASGTGTVTIQNNGSQWVMADDLTVGRNGTGELTIKNAASVFAKNALIGSDVSGSGLVTLSGLNSKLTATQDLAVGGSLVADGGAGVLTINPGTSTNVTGSVRVWSQGEIHLNGGTLQMGSLAIQLGQFNWNGGKVQFTQSTVLDDAMLTGLTGTAHSLGNFQTLQGPALSVETTSFAVEGGQVIASSFVNSGTTAVTKGGMDVSGQMTNNSQGTFVVQNTGHATFVGGVQNNGTFQLAGPAAKSSGGVFSNAGSLLGTGTLQHTLQNTGLVQVGATDRLAIASPIASTNTGTIQLAGGRLEFSGQLTNSAGGFISGNGTLATSMANPGMLGLNNQAIIAFSGGVNHVFGDVINDSVGRFIVSGGGVTTFHDDMVHNGNEIRTGDGSHTVFLGSVSGAGSYAGTGSVHFEGDLRPGNSPAAVRFDGDVYFGATAGLDIELGGMSAGLEFDQLVVDGQVSLDGMLSVHTINGFLPQIGNQFRIIDNFGSDAVLGRFLGLGEGAQFWSGGTQYQISYTGGSGNDVVLGVLTAVPEPGCLMLLTLATALGMTLRRVRMC